MMEKKCKWCGKTYVTFLHHQKYCTEKCQRKASKKRRRERGHPLEPQHTIKVCPVCYKTFVSEYSDKIYCSRKCGKSAQNKRRWQRINKK